MFLSKFGLTHVTGHGRFLNCTYINFSPLSLSHCLKSEPTAQVKNQKSFASMLRNSPLMQMGKLHSSSLIGKVFQVQDNNLFIDFGGKFHCVCPIPSDSEPKKFRRGTLVVIGLLDFEATARFLGAAQDTTLLEARANLIGLLQKNPDRNPTESIEKPNQYFVVEKLGSKNTFSADDENSFDVHDFDVGNNDNESHSSDNESVSYGNAEFNEDAKK